MGDTMHDKKASTHEDVTNATVCIVGLGYVGLPLAVAFGKKREIYGFDINKERIEQLNNNNDSTGEISKEDLEQATIIFSHDPAIIAQADIIIIAVPTPVDALNKPDLRPLLSASKTVGTHMKKDAIVVYESTVYPGCTERDCVPVLEDASGMTHLQEFTVGYSPERINPGDKEHTVDKIVKVVSGSDSKTTEILAALYTSIITAGVHKASSIKVAEAAKVIENTQRDINIALMNELKMVFDKMGIAWQDVLAAAGTKWNFLKFTPGLVGGHCIGVDPYYLAQEAQRVGHHPEIILAGRRINDSMAQYEADRFIKYVTAAGKKLKGLKVHILGATFKPDVPDLRNSKVENFAQAVASYGCSITFSEPMVTSDTIFGYPNLAVQDVVADCMILAVKHKAFDGIKADYVLME